MIKKKRFIIEYDENQHFNPTKYWFKDALFSYLKKELENGKLPSFFKDEHIDRRTILLLDASLSIKVFAE